MFCKSIKNNKFWGVLIVVGLVSLVFGIVANSMIPDDARNLSMFTGMFVGAGSAFIGIGVVKLVRLKTVSPEKLKQEEIELNDERNIQILRISYTIANATATIIFAIMAFCFVFLNYIIPALVSVVAIYVQLAAFLIAHKYYSKKM